MPVGWVKTQHAFSVRFTVRLGAATASGRSVSIPYTETQTYIKRGSPNQRIHRVDHGKFAVSLVQTGAGPRVSAFNPVLADSDGSLTILR